MKQLILTENMPNSKKRYKGSGDLYLTSGGRIVLDDGWGETYIHEGEKFSVDRKLFSLTELTDGIKLGDFLKRIGDSVI